MTTPHLASVTPLTNPPAAETGLRQQAVKTAVARLLDLQAQIKELQEVEEELKAGLRKALGRGEYTVDGYTSPLTITATRRFNPDLARILLTPEQLASITVEALDAKLAEKHLPAELVEQCRTDGVKDTVRLPRRTG